MSANADKWRWDQAQPAVQGIVWTFSHRSDEVPIRPTEFFGIVDLAFGAGEEETRHYLDAGKRGLQEMIITHLSELEPEAIEDYVMELGRLAGGKDNMQNWANFIGDRIKSGDATRVIPALEVLSDIAVGRMAEVELEYAVTG